MMNFLCYGKVNTLDYGIMISGEGTYNTPERNVESQEVAGRNGNLLFDMGNYKNIKIAYPAAMKDELPEKLSDFFNAMGSLTGYQRLEDTYHPEEYRMARYICDNTVETDGYRNRSGQFSIMFDCKPQRFLKSGELPFSYTAAGQIYNNTKHNAKPLIRVFGSGAGAVGIGSETITITAISSYMDIDCEIMDAYKGATNCNPNVSFTNDIVLKPGFNGISFTGAITGITLYPRWWII